MAPSVPTVNTCTPKHPICFAVVDICLFKTSVFQGLVLDESQSLEILKRMNRIVLILKVSGKFRFSRLRRNFSSK
jgi:hypothetical protein